MPHNVPAPFDLSVRFRTALVPTPSTNAQASSYHEPRLQRMGQRLRRCQDDNRASRPTDPSLQHPRNRKRQLPVQKQICPRTEKSEGENQNLDRPRRASGGNAGSVLTENQQPIRWPRPGEKSRCLMPATGEICGITRVAPTRFAEWRTVEGIDDQKPTLCRKQRVGYSSKSGTSLRDSAALLTRGKADIRRKKCLIPAYRF